MDKVAIVQTETTYEVHYGGYDYTVTSTENLEQGYLDWDVFDEEGNEVIDYSEGLHNEIVAFLIQNI
jgi:hypothetical protein